MNQFSQYLRAKTALCLTLAFAIAFPPNVMAQLASPSPEDVAAVRQQLDPEEQEKLDHMLEHVEELQMAFANQEGPQAALDDFDLIQQTVVDQRKVEVATRIKSIEENDFAIKRKEEVTFLRQQARRNLDRTIEYIGADRVQVAATLLNIEDPKAGLVDIINAAETNDEVAAALDIKPDNIEHFVDDDVPLRRLYRMNLKINVVEEVESPQTEAGISTVTGSLVATLDQKNAEGSTSVSFNSERGESTIFMSPQTGKYRFDITTSTGEVIHRFSRPVAAVGFYGRFIVYADKVAAQSQDGEAKFKLRFIDLDFLKGAIGNTQLPAFELPIAGQSLNSITIRDGKLTVNNMPIPYAGFQMASDIYQAFFNIKVALANPQTASSASSLIKELVYYKDLALQDMDAMESQMIKSALGGAQSLDEIVKNMETQLQKQSQSVVGADVEAAKDKIKEIAEENPGTLLTFNPSIDTIEKEVMDRNRLNTINQSVAHGRAFMSRLHLLMAKLTHPQPMGAPKLIQAMVMLAESTFKKDWQKAKQNFLELVRHPVLAYGKYGAGAIAAAALGANISDDVAMTIYQTLQFGKEHIIGYLEHTNYGMNFIELGGYAAAKAAEGPTSGVFKYFTELEWAARVGVLSSAIIGLTLSVYGSVHLIANTASAYKYFARKKGWIARAKAERLGMDDSWIGRTKATLGAYRDTFVKYENALRLYYNDGLARAEAAASGGNTKFNKAQDEIADEELKKLKSRPGAISRIMNAWRKSDKATDELTNQFADAGDKSEEFVEGLKKNTHLNQVTTLGKALWQFVLSYPNTIITARTNGTIWNYWFMIRTFALSPRSWPMFLIYPEMFRVAINKQDVKKVHMPSKLNGGYRTDIDNFKFVFNNLDTDLKLKDLKAFEQAVLPVEALAYEVALEKSLDVLIKTIKDPKQLKGLFDSTRSSGALPTTGIRSISDVKLNALSGTNRTFFRSVFNQIYEKTTETYLRNYLSIDAEGISGLKQEGIAKTQEMTKLNKSLQGSQAKRVQKDLQAIADDLLADGEVIEKAHAVSSNYTSVLSRVALNTEHKTVSKLDPNTRQVGRFKLAEKKLKDVKSVIRAINAMATEITIEKLGYLATILIMYSGVQGGMLQPVQEEMFGPDSWFYGSRYFFLNSFMSGLIISALANVWMKVQMDDRIDSTGAFDKVPTAADRDKSYLRYYLKSFWKNPVNSWKGNQLNSMQLAWSNLSAAFVTIAVTNFLTLGRFDLGAFMTGYMVVFLTPLSGIDYKLDQTHELASRWQSSKVAQKLRAHPKMQAWINQNVLAKRTPHSVLNTIYGMFMGPVVSLYELMDTPQFGKRSFLNLLFYGYQPEEIISQGLQTVNKYLGWIPGVEHVTATCESLLTNNNTALDPSKLINNPVKGGN